jgi:hypothetical protein
MRQRILNPPKGVQPTELEFEAKLGNVVVNELFKQHIEHCQHGGEKVEKPVLRFLDQACRSTTWEMLPDPKIFN